jgi:hypothetical protein
MQVQHIMHIIWKYVRPLRWWVALSLLLAAVAQILILAVIAVSNALRGGCLLKARPTGC